MMSGAALAALNHLLGQAGWARQRLAPFAGRHARLAMGSWQLAFAVSVDGLLTAAEEPATVDVVVTLPTDAPLAVFQGIEKAMAGAHVEGNAEFATALSFVFKHLSWDAEEDLSRFVGDMAAHRIVSGVRSVGAWQKEAARRLTDNVAEYLVEESPLLVRKERLAALADELRKLAEDLERLEQRVKRAASAGRG
jgi:ubiquinone biosynthesis accessory factor UbiJ